MVNSNKIKRILVVDDHEAARMVISKIMAKHGHVDLADNGHRALTMYAEALKDEWEYDLVCLDVTMPGLLNGNQVVRCIRAHEEKLEIAEPVPVVMISAFTDLTALTIERGLNGSNDYIVKPFSQARIDEVIQRFLY